MFRMAGLKRAALFAAILGIIAGVQAELPPWVYKERQEKSPEALVIRVRSDSQRETTRAAPASA
jgi:hypothetical protein